MKINWKQKLTSRKFWAAVVGLIVPVCVVLGVPDLKIEQIAAVITGVSGLIAYIVGEGLVDAARIKNSSSNSEESEGEK